MIVREFVHTLFHRMRERSPRVQVVLGARQVGKTTGVQQMLKRLKAPHLYVSADDTLTVANRWIQEQWQAALEKGAGAVLVIDEVQKIHNWAEIIKRLWDEQKEARRLKCILLGSSSLSLQKGLTESLAGRFELIEVHHWNFLESRKAFRYSLDTYLRYGGYPGAHAYIKDYERWFAYMKSAVVDPVIGQDILAQQSVAKPALFRQAFEILCGYPAQEVSYNKLLGQLQDRGNTDLVKHYVELYEGAFLFQSLFKYAAKHLRTKTSSPKIIPRAPALYTLAAGRHAVDNPDKKGHIFEALVGMDLLRIPGGQVYYWREGDFEVDYVLVHEGDVFGIEVKSGRRKTGNGLTLFKKHYEKAKGCYLTLENYTAFAQSPIEFVKQFAV
jgi:uncharacterized protein